MSLRASLGNSLWAACILLISIVSLAHGQAVDEGIDTCPTADWQVGSKRSMFTADWSRYFARLPLTTAVQMASLPRYKQQCNPCGSLSRCLCLEVCIVDQEGKEIVTSIRSHDESTLSHDACSWPCQSNDEHGKQYLKHYAASLPAHRLYLS
jgi:hypothetical protein